MNEQSYLRGYATALIDVIAALSHVGQSAVLEVRNRHIYQLNGQPWPTTYLAKNPELWSIDLR